jgi:hypothetical protein
MSKLLTNPKSITTSIRYGCFILKITEHNYNHIDHDIITKAKEEYVKRLEAAFSSKNDELKDLKVRLIFGHLEVIITQEHLLVQLFHERTEIHDYYNSNKKVKWLENLYADYFHVWREVYNSSDNLKKEVYNDLHLDEHFRQCDYFAEINNFEYCVKFEGKYNNSYYAHSWALPYNDSNSARTSCSLYHVDDLNTRVLFWRIDYTATANYSRCFDFEYNYDNPYESGFKHFSRSELQIYNQPDLKLKKKEKKVEKNY